MMQDSVALCGTAGLNSNERSRTTTSFHHGGIILFSWQTNLAILFSASLITAPVFASHVHRSPTAGTAAATTAHKTHKPATKKAPTLHGQQAIAPERVTQIQQALIREHYMNGEANGQWDSTTQAAMQKYQGDQGWQTKLMPDSRALKKLGLGADYSTAINAQTGSFAEPAAASSIPATQAAGFAAAAGTAGTNP